MTTDEESDMNAQETPRNRNSWIASIWCVALGVAGCSSSSSSPSQPATVPDFGAATFSNPTQVDNPFMPLVPGTVHTYVAESGGELETIVVEVLDSTKEILEVACVVVRDRVFEGGLLIEDTHDWFAQDDAGNVWYMGEKVDNYEYDEDGNVLSIDHEGAWQAGLDVAGIGVIAKPGHIMKADPAPGDVYHQEYYQGEAEDMGEVIALDVPVTLADGTTYSCLQIRDSTSLHSDDGEYKYFAEGIGLVLEEDVGGSGAADLKGIFHPGTDSVPDFGAAVFSDPTQIDNPHLTLETYATHTFVGRSEDEVETTVVEVLDTTRVVMGITCARVRDRVFLDGLLIEDTVDWFAQDDAGNVWYMGENVDNYEYDEDGNVVDIDHEGSWEAGVDGAEPGHVMKAAPVVGESYHQEFWEEEAEDMGLVVALGVTVEHEDGTTYDDCLQTLDWNPLEPDGLEYKFHAPGIGVVLEQALHEDEVIEFKGTFDTGPGSVPDFGAASFTDPTNIDNTYAPWVVGTIFTYEGESEDGPETVVVEVLATTRVVMGITCAIVEEQEFEGALLVEDSFNWFCQDDAGNVWYMGEDVTNYEYDEDGNLIGSDSDGSWEAGEDVAGTGQDAEPGHLMRASPTLGDSYHQEFYATEAEDLALVRALGVTVELENGDVYEDCLQTLEWDPLSPDELEHKFYAPDVGLILEEGLTEDERLELESVL